MWVEHEDKELECKVHVYKMLAGESGFKVGLTGSFPHFSGGTLETIIEANEAESQ